MAAVSLGLSTVVVYFLAKYKPKYFAVIIAGIGAIWVYAITTLYAVTKGVLAQQEWATLLLVEPLAE